MKTGHNDTPSKPIFDHTAHKAIWGYLAKNPDDEKRDAVMALGIANKFRIDCPACQAVQDFSITYKKHPSCKKYCPLDWDSPSCTYDADSLYDMWTEEYSDRKKAEIAAKIRDLPLKPGMEDLYKVI